MRADLRHNPTPSPEAAPPFKGVVHIAKPLAEGFADRLTLRLDELAHALGVSRRAIERERSAGRFPPPDLTIGRMPLWRLETIVEWANSGGERPHGTVRTNK
jgi:predicted DNA-binding transcriptional regulator AlpA